MFNNNFKFNLKSLLLITMVVFCAGLLFVKVNLENIDVVNAQTTIIVNPGESIQEAINNLPAEGGVVELATGVHTPTACIEIINKTDITIIGASVNREDTEIKYDVDVEPAFNTFNVENSANITFENIYIYSIYTGYLHSDAAVAIKLENSDNITVSNIRVERFNYGVETTFMGYGSWDPEDEVWYLTIEDCLFSYCRGGARLMDTNHSIVRRCESSYHQSFAGIYCNRGVKNTTIEDNICHHNAFDGIYMYNSNVGNTIKNNTLYNNKRGVTFYASVRDTTIIDNTIKDNTEVGILLHGHVYTMNNIQILNNRIYNNGKEGVVIEYHDSVNEGAYTVNIESNTIYSNGLDGIRENIPYYTITAKNNIITNNSGYGVSAVNSGIACSYNNFWNNTLGEYAGVINSTADISINPLFISTISGSEDFHLKSQFGRWNGSIWVSDTVTSFCIDAGNPSDDYSNEPSTNGDRINMGVYGNTIYASKSSGGAPDTTPPIHSNGFPSGTLSCGTTSTALSLATDENATCKYSTTPNTSYPSMSNTFSTTGSLSHSTTVSGLSDGNTYTYYVRCQDTIGNLNTDDYSINFSIASEPQTGELVAHYKFNESAGDIATDSSGNNNDGILVNSPAWVDGKIGSNALSFDGYNDYVNCGNEESLLTVAGSFEAWIKLANTDTDRGIYGINENIWTDYLAIYYDDHDRIQVKIEDDNVVLINLYSPGNSIADTNWHHIVVAQDGTQIRIYIDGVNKTLTGTNSGNWASLLSPLDIRLGYSGGGYGYFNGSIDDVRIYSRALTPAEVLAHYNEANDTAPPTRSNGSPSGTLSYGTTSTILSLTTDENATCKYSTTANTSYSDMTGTFSTTGALSHSQTISGLIDGQSYTYYIKCQDTIGNFNIDDYPISFSIADSPVNHDPIGSLDSADQSQITGWAYDQNAGINPINVHIYIDGINVGSAVANQSRPDIIGAGSGQVQDPNHGFSFITPSLSVGEHTVSVYAINQPEGTNPELVGSPITFTVSSSDTTPPTGSIQINSGDEKTNSQTVNLSILANDPSGLSEMKISNSNDFNSVVAETYSTIKSFILSTGDGIKTIYIWFKDNIGNWNTSPYSDTIILDSTSPTISNISISNITTSTAIINFQTNEESTSYIEYGTSVAYGFQLPANSELKTDYSISITGLGSNTEYHFRVVSRDELENELNSIDQTFKTIGNPDITPPSKITDLSSSNITQTSADLLWTSQGDDGNNGTSAEYDLRYSSNLISDSSTLLEKNNWWDNSTQLTGEPIPSLSGTEQYISVGLSSNTNYYFIIKSADEVPNWSDYSNILSLKTLTVSAPPPSGGGGTVSDTTPPSQPSSFKAIPADSQITLNWKNPLDSDFVRVTILRISADPTLILTQKDAEELFKGCPLNCQNQNIEVIYEGNKQQYTDINLNNNTAYYYSIFSYDKKPNYSKILSLSSKPEKGKTSIEIPNGYSSYPEGTLLKTPDSFKIYIIINQKKKWIPTPEVFETLGYQWTKITIIDKNELILIPDYEDNLIRAINDFKVYLIVNGIKRHIPNPEIFLNYGFEWNEVKDVNLETINQYTQANLIKESKKEEIYYLCPERKIKRWLRSPEIFNSYPDNNWNNIQVISKYEMDHYPTSNLIQLIGDNNVYLIENNRKRLINSVEEFEREGLDWNLIMGVGEREWEWFE